MKIKLDENEIAVAVRHHLRAKGFEVSEHAKVSIEYVPGDVEISPGMTVAPVFNVICDVAGVRSSMPKSEKS